MDPTISGPTHSLIADNSDNDDLNASCTVGQVQMLADDNSGDSGALVCEYYNSHPDWWIQTR